MVSLAKAQAMTKDQLVVFASKKRPSSGKKGKSGHKSGHRRKKNLAQRTVQGLGIFPFAPIRLMRNAGYMNYLTSTYLGRDFNNGFKGQASINEADLKSGKVRGDIVDLWTSEQTSDLTIGQKLRATGFAWMWHTQANFTTGAGARRAVAPAVAGEIQFQVAKGFKANQVLPPQVRKFIRFT